MTHKGGGLGLTHDLHGHWSNVEAKLPSVVRANVVLHIVYSVDDFNEVIINKLVLIRTYY